MFPVINLKETGINLRRIMDNDVFTGEYTNLDTIPTIDWNDIVPGQPAFLWDEVTSSWVLNPYYRNIGENWY